MPARRADATRRNYGIDFSDLNDGIDWEHMLPPEVFFERELQRFSQPNPVRTTMFVEWPISETDFRIPERIMRLRETTYRFTGSPRAQSRRSPRSSTGVQEMILQEYEFHPGGGQMSQATIRRVEPHSQSRRAGLNATPHQASNNHANGQRNGFLSDLATSMLNIDYAGALLAPALNIMGNALSMAFAPAGSGVVSTQQQSRGHRNSGEAGINGGLFLSLEMDSHDPSHNNSTARSGERASERFQSARPRRNANRSGVEYDIITNLLGHSSLINNHPAGMAQLAENVGWEIGDFSYENLLRLDSGNKAVGIPQNLLRAMKPIPYANIQKQNDSAKNTVRSNEDQAVCAICLEKLNPKQMVLDLGCGHVFHHPCIIKWLKRSTLCPTCRREVQQNNRAR